MSHATPSRQQVLVRAILVLGALVRLGYYLARPSLTIDETTLALDLGLRSFGELSRPLASLQTGPLLFLWGEKACITVLGMNEYALRLIPLVAGLLVPWLVWRVGRRLLPEPAPLLAAALAATAPALIQYSVTAKPYITDALVVLLVVQCTLDLLERSDSAILWWRFGLVGVVSVVASLPAPFALAGAATAVVMSTPPSMRRTALRLIACAAGWSALWVVLYVRVYGPVAMSWYMRQFWGPASFALLRADGWWNLARGLLMSLIGRPAPPVIVIACADLVGLGYWAWMSRLPRAHAALVGVPWVVLLVASAQDRYPLAARLLMFAVPLLVMALASLVARATVRAARLGWAVGALILVSFLGVGVLHPYRPPATRQAVDSLRKLLGPGEPVYLASGSIPAWAFYTTDWRTPDTAYLSWIGQVAGTPGEPAFHNSPPRGHPVGMAEGADLQTKHAGRVELLALASGIQWQEGRGFGVQVHPDSGWAEHEATRIGAVAAPTAWLLIANAYPRTVADLYAALARAGAERVQETAVGGVRIVQVRFFTHAN